MSGVGSGNPSFQRKATTMTMATMFTAPTIHPTRYPELGYCNWRRGDWRFHAMDAEDAYKGQIGPIYLTRAELLADLPRFARENLGLKI
jgi:hypothetical protein